MPLQQLVHHFNDRFEHTHHSNYRPFFIENDRVTGVFGPIGVSSAFTPVRHAHDGDTLAGHIAQLVVSPFDNIRQAQTDNKPPDDFQSIINLDRLCRTVHMLNYLPFSHWDGVLFLDVDPRHVLGVSENHGAYFEEVIEKCGLATQNVGISLSINPYYAQHHSQLLAGLFNYRQRGYQIALNIGHAYSARGLVDLIAKLKPDFLRVNAPGSGQDELDSQIVWPSALRALQSLQDMAGGHVILQQVDEEKQAFVVSGLGFTLVQGRYYDRLSIDHLRCL